MVGPSGLNQLPHLLVGNRLDIQFPALTNQLRDDATGLSPAARAAHRQDPAPQRVAQSAQRPQPPEDFVQTVDDHVFVADRLGGQGVGMLVEKAGHGAFVPVVERSGLVTHKEDDVLAQLVDVVHVGHQVAPAVAPRVEQDRVGRFDLVVVCGQFLRASDGRQRQELERKVGLRRQLVQLAMDAGGFRLNVFLRLDAAPASPTRLRSALGFGIGEDRLDLQGSSFRRGLRLGSRDGRP